MQQIIRLALEIDRQQGFVTFDQLDKLLPASAEVEDIEAVMAALSTAGIDLREG